MKIHNIAKVVIAILTVVKCASSLKRITQATVNPNCYSFCEGKNITTVYLRSESDKDALHYVWDFTGKPSVLFAVTGPSAQLVMNWESFLWGKENSIQFTETPKYSFGVVVLKIYEFNDVNDTGNMNTVNNGNITVLHTKKFDWVRKSFAQNSEYFELSMEGSNYKSGKTRRNGTVKFLLNRFWTLDHSDIMPHILHTENSTQIDVIIDNFETNPSYSSSRFALELLIVGNYSVNSTMHIDVKKTLDDEHTPGIFEMAQITTPVCDVENGGTSCDGENYGGYLQWRPVSYTAADRDVTSSTGAEYYPLTHVVDHAHSVNNSLLYSFYGYTIDRLLLQKVNISLGSKGDGFYKKGNYSSWTFTVGYGTPPDERFSFLVIMVISIGLGLPAILIIAAGIYVCVRNRYKETDTLSLNS